jgi:hypothetical protein
MYQKYIHIAPHSLSNKHRSNEPAQGLGVQGKKAYGKWPATRVI